MRQRRRLSMLTAMAGLCFLSGCDVLESEIACLKVLAHGDIQRVAKEREQRFLGKVPEERARCLGGERAVALRQGPWLDWPNFWGAGDVLSKAPLHLLSDAKYIGPNAHGINGALYELELQRIELIKFNLLDNNGTYKSYVTGREGKAGPVLKTWSEMQLPPTHPHFNDVGAQQVCKGELIRFRTQTGIC
ncbi:MAG: oxygenase, partial [Nitrospirae bacterium]|nr:oxygenase [Nitrospirota bacterium]